MAEQPANKNRLSAAGGGGDDPVTRRGGVRGPLQGRQLGDLVSAACRRPVYVVHHSSYFAGTSGITSGELSGQQPLPRRTSLVTKGIGRWFTVGGTAQLPGVRRRTVWDWIDTEDDKELKAPGCEEDGQREKIKIPLDRAEGQGSQGWKRLKSAERKDVLEPSNMRT